MPKMRERYKFRCWDCGCYFNEYKEEREYRGDYGSIPAFETVFYCPYCNGSFDNADYVDRYWEED